MENLIDYSQLWLLLNVAIAMALGALLGLEREYADKPAGLRTHMIVAGSAALLVSLGEPLIDHFDVTTSGSTIRTDPIRIIEAIITGVSFLGAGTIIYRQSRGIVEGLTTAAALLLSAGVGICVGLEQFTLGIGVTLLSLLTLRGVGLISEGINRHSHREAEGLEDEPADHPSVRSHPR